MPTIDEIVKSRQEKAVALGIPAKAAQLAKTLGNGGGDVFTYGSPSGLSYVTGSASVQIQEQGRTVFSHAGMYDKPHGVLAYCPGSWETLMAQDVKRLQEEMDRRAASDRARKIAEARKMFGITDVELFAEEKPCAPEIPSPVDAEMKAAPDVILSHDTMTGKQKRSGR